MPWAICFVGIWARVYAEQIKLKADSPKAQTGTK